MRLTALLAALTLFAAPGVLSAASEGGAVGQTTVRPSSIVIGFVGGFVRHDNPNHGPVQFAELLQRTASDRTYVRVFENRHRRAAFRTIMRLLDRDGDGVLSPEEKTAARIILYGESWGGTAAVLLARDLNRAGVRVMLTVQIDSVAKLWERDAVIPPNVAAAVNFYQPHGFVHGRSQIRAADPSRTQVLGNYRSDYKQNPVTCVGYSWADRTFTPGHMQSECDPRVWGQVEALVRERLDTPNSVAANPTPLGH